MGGSIWLLFLDAMLRATRRLSTQVEFYKGPLSATLKRLKVFSISSLALTTALTPFMMIIESNLPIHARVGLVAAALGTSGLNTALVNWVCSPYIVSMKKLPADGTLLHEITTQSLFLRPRITTVYDPAFLVDTRRPFAKWTLADQVTSPPSLPDPPVGQEETVAETKGPDGTVLGRWVVKWQADGRGICHATGNVVRSVYSTFCHIKPRPDCLKILQFSAIWQRR